jgi:hypothetical protein
MTENLLPPKVVVALHKSLSRILRSSSQMQRLISMYSPFISHI